MAAYPDNEYTVAWVVRTLDFSTKSINTVTMPAKSIGCLYIIFPNVTSLQQNTVVLAQHRPPGRSDQQAAGQGSIQ